MEEKKKQEFKADENFEIEESNAMKVLKGKGEDGENPHESHLPQKKVGAFENFWYLHKWHLGIGVFVAVLVIVLVCQLIFKAPNDVYIMYTGPVEMVGNKYEKLEDAFEDAMGDYNEDGKKEISFTDNTFLTEAEIERRVENSKLLREQDPNYPIYTYDATANNAAYQRFMAEITSGSHLFLMLDPDLYRGLAEQGAFVPLSDIFEDIPEYATEEYGIRLGDTEFYQSNEDIDFLPSDTMLAVRIPSTLDMKSDKKKTEKLEFHKELLRDIVEYTAPEEE